MDPYLEAPSIWPDFHHAFASEIRNELNQSLPSPYYARVEMRAELGIVEEDQETRRAIVPDVPVLRQPRQPADAGTVAVLDRPRREESRWVEFEVPGETLRHHFVEILDATRGHKLITLIEVLSPSNKRPGPDRDAYAAKQRDVLQSDASLVEIDLLRGGQRVLPGPVAAASFARIQPTPDYVVLVSRAWRRTDQGLGYRAFPFGLREWLPCVGIPLRREEPEVPLDLQFVFNRAYDGGPYRRGAVDYTRPPDPPLSPEDAAWAEALLHQGEERAT
jgi:hypothetical protein